MQLFYFIACFRCVCVVALQCIVIWATRWQLQPQRWQWRCVAMIVATCLRLRAAHAPGYAAAITVAIAMWYHFLRRLYAWLLNFCFFTWLSSRLTCHNDRLGRLDRCACCLFGFPFLFRLRCRAFYLFSLLCSAVCIAINAFSSLIKFQFATICGISDYAT